MSIKIQTFCALQLEMCTFLEEFHVFLNFICVTTLATLVAPVLHAQKCYVQPVQTVIVNYLASFFFLKEVVLV